MPSVQASGSSGIRPSLFDTASRLQNLHSLQDAAYQQHVPLTVINSLPHLAAPILFPPAAAIVTTATTSFNLDTRLPDPGFSPKKFPQDKTNEKFAIDLHKFMYATGDERNTSGDAGGEARKTALGGSKILPKPVSSTYKSDDKGS